MSTFFTYHKASEIILKKTVRQSQETIKQMSDNYQNFYREYMTRSIILLTVKQLRKNFGMGRKISVKKDIFRGERTETTDGPFV